MKKRKPDSKSPGEQRTSGFRDISHEILLMANQVLQKRDFLPKVSLRLLETFKCEELELWTKEEELLHYRCVVNRLGTIKTNIQLIPQSFDAELDIDQVDDNQNTLEWLSNQVINKRLSSILPQVTENGSLWICDTNKSSKLNPGDQERPLFIAGGFLSFVIVPILSKGKCIGLIHLRSKDKDFFTREDIRFCEDLSQTIEIALAHQNTQIELRERLKELTCLYEITKVIAETEISTGQVLQGIVELLPPAWLYPDISSARIILEDKTYTTQGFRETPYMQSSDIIVDGEPVGAVQVAYAEKSPDLDEGPFLSEERSLIDNVARKVAHFYEREKDEAEKSFLQDQLRHADRLATIGQLAAGVAHELNEPLGNILGFAQLTQKTPNMQEQTKKDIEKIVSASLHAREIIKKLMVFARQLPPKKAPVNLNEIVEEGIFFFEARCAKAGIDLVRHYHQNLPEIVADPGQLNQVLVNLVVNAIQAMPDGGVLTVETQSQKDHALLIVEDTGMGMSEKVKNQIFVPFFTTKEVNEGTGLGLPVVHGIVTSHKGAIVVKSRIGAGTRFEIRLPIGKQPSDAEKD